MIEVILYVLAVFAVWAYMTVTTWERYLAVMALKRARDAGKLSGSSKAWGYAVAARAVVTDAIYNMVFGTIMFCQPPTEFLFTARLERNMKRDDWRGVQARYWCRSMLDAFDPDGKHCG